MASPAVDFHDRDFDNNYDSFEYGLSSNIAGIYEKPLHLMLDAIFYYPHPVSDSDSPPQVTSAYGSVFWSHGGVQEHDLTNRPASDINEEGQLHYNGGGGGSNWLSEYGSSICQGLGEDFQFSGWGTDDKAHDGGGGGGEEEYHSHYTHKENQTAYDHYSPWSGSGSWFGCGVEEDFHQSSRQEPKLTHGFSDGFGIYQGIFGYWPCLHQKNYNEQEAYDHENPWSGTEDHYFEYSFS